MALQAFEPFACVSGAKAPRAVIVGEAWGKDEAPLAMPFVGASGKELFLMLGEAFADVEPELHSNICLDHPFGSSWVFKRDTWLEAAGIAFTNVFALQPPGNRIEELCSSKKVLGKDYSLPPVKPPGNYIRPEFLDHVERLKAEIDGWKPNLVIAMGNTATWALLLATNISSIRGAVAMSRWSGPSVKVLPTYHPANVLYQWSQRPIVVTDLMKAAREMRFAEIRRPRRQVLINPTIDEVERFTDLLLATAKFNSIGPLEVGGDCETQGGQISMISFAPTKAMAIVIPFIDESKPGWSYWPTEELEIRAWRCVRRICGCAAVRIVGQNFIYDMQYLWPAKVPLARVPEDTMMLHHSLYPEMSKGLGFLGSVYTDEASWKLMRTHKPDTEKRDE